jgi:hypothetical protein
MFCINAFVLFILKKVKESFQKMTRLKAGRTTNQGSIPSRDKTFTLCPQNRNRFGDHAPSCPTVIGGGCVREKNILKWQVLVKVPTWLLLPCGTEFKPLSEVCFSQP